jgi:hypothetical protein
VPCLRRVKEPHDRFCERHLIAYREIILGITIAHERRKRYGKKALMYAL